MFSFSTTCSVNIDATCISAKKTYKITEGKKYTINELSHLSSYVRVECDTGRNVWYPMACFDVSFDDIQKHFYYDKVDYKINLPL